MIPKHQRDNFESASEAANQINRLIYAAYTIAEEINHSPEQLEQADSLFVLLNIAQEKLAELNKAHKMVWVAMGGNSLTLSDGDIKAARGDESEVAA